MERLMLNTHKLSDRVNAMNKRPVHLAFCPDGNRKYARNVGLTYEQSYKKGIQVLKNMLILCLQERIPIMSTWITSLENWNRPDSDLKLLNDLIENTLSDIDFFMANGIRFNPMGDLNGFPIIPKMLIDVIEDVAKLTKNNTELIFNAGFNYTGRQEIMRAMQYSMKDIQDGKRLITDFDYVNTHKPFFHPNEQLFEKYLYTNGLPDVDLMVYTGYYAGQWGCAFLLWQSMHAYIINAGVPWPLLTMAQVQSYLDEYAEIYDARLALLGKEKLNNDWSIH